MSKNIKKCTDYQIIGLIWIIFILSLSGCSKSPHPFSLENNKSSKSTNHNDSPSSSLADTQTLDKPVANAGVDRFVNIGDVVILDGTASRVVGDNTKINYSWTTSTDIVLTGIGTANPKFLVPEGIAADTKLTFSLTITDSLGATSDIDEVEIRIENAKPIAVIGSDQQAIIGELIQFSADASRDLNGDMLSYQWMISDGIILENPETKTVSLRIPNGTPVGKTFELSLVVADGITVSEKIFAKLTTLNSPPIAQPGLEEQTHTHGNTLVLDGSASYDDNAEKLTFWWRVILAPNNSTLLSWESNDMSTEFTPDVKGDYTITLEVYDQLTFDTKKILIRSIILVPEMVDLSGGEFLMGDNTSPDGLNKGSGEITELPQHTTSPFEFSLSRYEISFNQYDQYLKTRDLPISNPSSIQPGEEAYDNNIGREKKPVINISIQDVYAYIDWLNRQLDIPSYSPRRFRLPAEAEWEYAARAGSTSNYSTGECINLNNANYAGGQQYQYIDHNGEQIICDENPNNSPKNNPLDVGSYDSNSFGLNDLHGNVWEWVEDCWVNNYVDAPTNGSARVIENCVEATARGGAWFSPPNQLRSAYRQSGVDRNKRSSGIGFRLAKSISYPVEIEPTMITLENASFSMGDETSKDGIRIGLGEESELPVRTVAIQKFSIGKFEVSFGEYDLYLDSIKPKSNLLQIIGDNQKNINPIHEGEFVPIIFEPEAADNGWGRGLLPVVNVSKKDILSFINWLNKQKGYADKDPYRFRLPTEAEWEYAARAGTETAYSFGDCISTKNANFNGKLANNSTNCAPTIDAILRTTEVDSYQDNLFRLKNMNGNVWEWVADCWHENYINAPTDSSAWIKDCELDNHVIRGGSWRSNSINVRSASRLKKDNLFRNDDVGFRLARTVP